MNKKFNEKIEYDFVARDTKNNKICVRSRTDSFEAIKREGKWEKGYPTFDDLMDNFQEVKDLSEVVKISTEARIAIR